MEILKIQKPPEEETNKLDRVIEQEKEPDFEDFDFWTFSFVKEHIDIPEFELDPGQELKEIRKIIRETPEGERSSRRKILVEDFKKKLKKFRENLSKAQLEFEILLKNGPDEDENTFLNKLDKIVDRNNVRSQLHYFQNALYSFLDTRKKITELVQEYKNKYGKEWEVRLFSNLFGKEPKGKISVDILPVDIYIHIHDIEDYVYALTERENDQLEQEKIGRTSGGAKLIRDFPGAPYLKGKVLIENSTHLSTYSEEAKLARTKEIKIHEEEHTIHDFYPSSTFIKQEHSLYKIFDLTDEVDLEQFKDSLNKYAHLFVLEFEKFAKDEILAYLKTGESTPLIRKVMLDDMGLYNYLEDVGNDKAFLDRILGHIDKQSLKIKKQDNAYLSRDELKILILDTIKRAWSGQYKDAINKALDSVEQLTHKYGYNPETRAKILRLLSQEPLNKWPRLARILS